MSGRGFCRSNEDDGLVKTSVSEGLGDGFGSGGTGGTGGGNASKTGGAVYGPLPGEDVTVF